MLEIYTGCVNFFNYVSSGAVEASLIKDYFAPIFIPVLSAITGAFIAYWLYSRQEDFRVARERLDCGNKWLLIFAEMFTHLCQFKHAYLKNIGTHPLERAGRIAAFTCQNMGLPEDYYRLNFIVAKHDELPEMWQGLGNISALIKTFVEVQDIWEKREDIDRSMRAKIVDAKQGGVFAECSIYELEAILTQEEIANWIVFTEQAIVRTDFLLVQILDLLEKLPLIIKSRINRAALKKYGTPVVLIESERQGMTRYAIKAPPPDFDRAASYLGMKKEDVEKMFSFGMGNPGSEPG